MFTTTRFTKAMVAIMEQTIKNSIGNSLKGWYGEFQVNLGYSLILDNNIYKKIKNITIDTGNGTTQIDHIIVSIYGIFVIETKNYNGWIFGNESSKSWTQSVFGKKNSFQNPLMQNYKHIKSLQKLLELNENHFHSLVLFIGESTFKTEMPENVIDRDFSTYILRKKTHLLSVAEVDEVVRKIETQRKADTFKTSREHRSSLKERYSDNTKCPKCDSALTIRTTKSGANAGRNFYGCTNFPKCRYMRSM